MSRKNAIFLFTSIFFSLVLVMPGYCSEKPTCAVLMFHPDMASSDMNEGQTLSKKYADLLDRLDMFDVIDYKKIDEILINKNAEDLDKSCTDLGCALKIGNKLNADFVIYGIIGNVGSLYSLDTTLVNVAGGNETQHALYDFEGTREEFSQNAPAENIKSLFGLYEIPAAMESPAPAMVNAVDEQPIESETNVQTATPVAKKPKSLHYGPRLGLGASDDGIEIGAGFEVQFSRLAYQLVMNGDGFATGFSFYLHPEGNTPFLSVVGSYYDKEHHGVDEIGRIYGLLLGYRIALSNYVHKDFAKHIDTRIGVGAGYVNWDQTELNRAGVKDGDDEFIPIFEFTIGYMF